MRDPGYIRQTRASYDVVAADYADLLRTALAAKPLERALLTTFGELVGTRGSVADLGCGPGRITAYLHSIGMDVFGIDLSPGMIAVARAAYPELRFDEGSILDLPLADEVVGGVVAWYSIIHTPPELLPRVFGEFHRVLSTGGQLLLAFQVGETAVHLSEAYGHNVSLDAHRLSPDHVAELLAAAGFAVHTRVVCEPGLRESTQQAYLIANKS